CWLTTRVNEELIKQVPEEKAKCAEFEHKCEEQLGEMQRIMAESLAVYLTNG
ncbi:unnamed protein product, partial [Adineta steineri]